MKTIFDDIVLSCYGQAYVHIKDTYDYANEVRRGQVNGLLGAVQPSTLFLTFGLHTGNVKLTIRVADTAPPVDELWEEVVEASFNVPTSQVIEFMDWNGIVHHQLELAPGSNRVRYTAINFGSAEDIPESENDASPIEHYELTFWPEAHGPDKILKTTRASAQYWHDLAQGRVP
jgi:hypothetical protein